MKFDDEVSRQLDAVVGDRFDPPQPWRTTLVKWLAAAILAVVAAALIVAVLEHYLVKAHTDQPRKPVTIQIIPQR